MPLKLWDAPQGASVLWFYMELNRGDYLPRGGWKISSSESRATKTGAKEGAAGFAVATGSKELFEPE